MIYSLIFFLHLYFQFCFCSSCDNQISIRFECIFGFTFWSFLCEWIGKDFHSSGHFQDIFNFMFDYCLKRNRNTSLSINLYPIIEFSVFKMLRINEHIICAKPQQLRTYFCVNKCCKQTTIVSWCFKQQEGVLLRNQRFL